MKNGRINERNMGSHKLDGGAKNAKCIKPKYTEEQYDLIYNIRLCEQLLTSKVQILDNQLDVMKFVILNGFVEILEIENTTITKSIRPILKYAILKDEFISNMNDIKNSLINQLGA